MKLGHFAPIRWSTRGSDEWLHEVFVAGEALALPAERVVEVVLHEASHALAHARQIVDTSRQGRYHNRRFVAVAGDVGLAWPLGQHPDLAIGYSSVTITDATRHRYRKQIAALEAVVTAARRLDPSGETRTQPGSRLVRAECECGRIIRAARATLAAGDICTMCDSIFEPDTVS